MPGLDPLAADDLRIDPTLDTDGAILCVWKGKSNHRYPARLLGPWFERLLVQAQDRHISIRMRFDELQHFNSSTIGAIVQLIQHAKVKGVMLTLVYSGAQRWQRVSFEALRVFEKGNDHFRLEMA